MFFFNDTATTEIYTLSLHDALPISRIRPVHRLAGSMQGPCHRSAGPRGTDGPGSVVEGCGLRSDPGRRPWSPGVIPVATTVVPGAPAPEQSWAVEFRHGRLDVSAGRAGASAGPWRLGTCLDGP